MNIFIMFSLIYDMDEHSENQEYIHDKSPFPCHPPTWMNDKKIRNKPLAEVLN
jgi:hypothetical protein